MTNFLKKYLGLRIQNYFTTMKKFTFSRELKKESGSGSSGTVGADGRMIPSQPN